MTKLECSCLQGPCPRLVDKHGNDMGKFACEMYRGTPAMSNAGPSPETRGNCYVTSEAVYHLTGAHNGPWRPQTLRHEGDVHWYLKNKFTGEILDLTVAQFGTMPDYSFGRGRGFLTKEPSRRAVDLMNQLVWQPAPVVPPSAKYGTATRRGKSTR